MVFRTTVVVLTAVAAAVSAAPSVLRNRQGPSSYNPACEGTPAGSRAFVNDFRMTALNTTLPNANTTGVPLVIGSVSATTGAESYSLSVNVASYPYNQRPNLELFEGRLFAWGSDHTTPSPGYLSLVACWSSLRPLKVSLCSLAVATSTRLLSMGTQPVGHYAPMATLEDKSGWFTTRRKIATDVIPSSYSSRTQLWHE